MSEGHFGLHRDASADARPRRLKSSDLSFQRLNNVLVNVIHVLEAD